MDSWKEIKAEAEIRTYGRWTDDTQKVRKDRRQQHSQSKTVARDRSDQLPPYSRTPFVKARQDAWENSKFRCWWKLGAVWLYALKVTQQKGDKEVMGLGPRSHQASR